jgi:branched-subunit amino acid aminotransferase/4-amino-4-deoxychorismate lyase
MTQYCFLNGQILPIEEAKVSILDIGLLRGFGIYDGLAGIGGKPFRFGDHWNRFSDGAHALDLNIPITEETCEKKIIEILEKSDLLDRANIRMILTGGPTIGGIEYVFETPTFYITVEKWESLPQEYYKTGAKLVTYNHLREIPEHKTTNYIRAVNLQNWRKEEKAVEILYLHDGEVLECATSNICLVKDGIIVTPAENVLKGITLKVVLELAESAGYKIEKRLVYQDELKTADEIFITSSFKDIVPIVKIDDFEVGQSGAKGQVGPVSKDLIERFAEAIKV